MAPLSWGAAWRRAGALAALVAGTSAGAAAQSQRASEYQVKAAFLFNFTQFVDWPVEAFPDSNAPLVIGVLGDDPFGPALDAIVSGETVRGRRLEVRRFHRASDATACHVLFISRSETTQLEAILATLGNRPVLTVSDDALFARRGGVIGFVVERSRVRLRISLAAAQAARLTISSKLLRLAEIVSPRRS